MLNKIHAGTALKRSENIDRKSDRRNFLGCKVAVERLYVIIVTVKQ